MESGYSENPENVAKAQKLLDSIGIPSHPSVLTDINKEACKPDPNLRVISSLISKDLALSAKVIKIAGSPFFGSRKIGSIDEALFTLGLKSFNNLVLTSSLRSSLESYSRNDSRFLEKFWEHSLVIAKSAAFIAKKKKRALQDMAYMTGLFHDCAIPMFLKKFRDYPDLLEMAMGPVHMAALKKVYKSIIGEEEQRYDTNHCLSGYLVAKSWHLPPAVCGAICYHHYRDLSVHKDPDAAQLVSIIILAEYLSLDYDVFVSKTGDNIGEWILYHENILTLLDVSENDVLDFREDIHEMLLSEIYK